MIDHEMRLAGNFRPDHDGVCQVCVLVGEILDEQGDLVALAAPAEPEIPDVVGRPIERGHLGIYCIAPADMAVVEARKSGPARSQVALVLDVAIDGDLRYVVDGATHQLRTARSLLSNTGVRVTDSEAERELRNRPPAEFELEAGTASGA